MTLLKIIWQLHFKRELVWVQILVEFFKKYLFRSLLTNAKGRYSVLFLRWLGHSSLRSSLCERSNAELGSHSPLGDRIFFVGRGFTPAVLFSIAFFRREQAPALRSSTERANHGAKRSYPSAKHIFLYIFLKLCYNSLNK